MGFGGPAWAGSDVTGLSGRPIFALYLTEYGGCRSTRAFEDRLRGSFGSKIYDQAVAGRPARTFETGLRGLVVCELGMNHMARGASRRERTFCRTDSDAAGWMDSHRIQAEKRGSQRRPRSSEVKDTRRPANSIHVDSVGLVGPTRFTSIQCAWECVCSSSRRIHPFIPSFLHSEPTSRKSPQNFFYLAWEH